MESDDEVPLLIQHDNRQEESPKAHRIPLTIITGFLGAGKTTLLRRILTENHGYRIAVIMNEFADTADIEAKTITVPSQDDPTGEWPESEELLELANGCLCCSIKNSCIAAIEKLMYRKGSFDHILLETTGLADPGPIASMFWQNEEFAEGLGKDIALDGVVCVVDAVFGNKQIEEDSTVEGDSVGESLRQIGCADLILLNKVDLVSDTEVSSLEAIVHRVNPVAPVYHTIKAQIDPNIIMEIGAYHSSFLPHSNTRVSCSQLPAHADEHQHEHEHPPSSHHHYTTRGISSLQLRCPLLDSPSRLARLDEWIRTLLWENRLPSWYGPADDHYPVSDDQEKRQDHPELQVFRCKGLLRMHTGQEYVLQGVRSIYELREVSSGGQGQAWGKGQRQGGGDPLDTGKIVLIGKGLNEKVGQSFEGIFSP